MGESLRSVTSRFIVNAHEPLSSLPFICLLYLRHLSSPEPQMSQHMLSTIKNSFIGFSLHGKHRAGACGCRSQRNGGDEIDDEKNHSLLIQCSLLWKQLLWASFSIFICIFPPVLFLSLIILKLLI